MDRRLERRVVMGGVWLVAVACGPEAVSDDGSGGGTAMATTETGAASQGMTSAASTGPGADTTGGSTTGPDPLLPPGCACKAVEDGTCDELSPTECEGEPLCEQLEIFCSRPNPDMYACDAELEYSPPESVVCMLEALRDRTPGKLLVRAENDTCGFEGCGSDREELSITADGQLVFRSCSASPISPEGAASTLRQLAPPDYFDGCLAQPTSEAQYDCLRDGLTDPMPLCD